jgi:hypothetical protein
VEWLHHQSSNPVCRGEIHAFANAAHEAFDLHHPLVTGPDDVWSGRSERTSPAYSGRPGEDITVSMQWGCKAAPEEPMKIACPVHRRGLVQASGTGSAFATT